MKKSILPKLIFLFLFVSNLQSQELNLSAFLIPQELTKDANAVIRNASLEVTIEDVDQMIVYEKKIITILNKSGDRYSTMYQHYDDDTKITKLSASVYNHTGNQIKKYTKSKFLDVSAVSDGTLYSDSRVKYLDYTPISYPYTIVLESEYKTSSTGFIPRWFPMGGYYVAVEKSSYKLNNPKQITIRKKEKSFKEYAVKDNSTDFNIEYVLENQPAIKRENLSLPSRDFMPYLILAADNFSLKGTNGKASNWKEFGKWMYDALLEGRNVIDESTKTKVLKLTEGINNPIEKAKLIYDYVQNKTRYISVQVGIGGWEPIEANEVDKLGYGDCKGLTNYTKALLDVVGVTSYYTVVYASEKRNLDKDFASIQGNHVILNIPNEKDDIWLECTSQVMPFGFLGDFTDDRDVLVVTPEGGIIKHTPAYLNEQNLQTTQSEIQLLENGDVSAKLTRVSKGTQYDEKFYRVNLSEEDLHKRYKTRDWSYINNLEIVSASLENDEEKIVFTEDLEISVKNYASVNENEYLFRVNIFNKNSYVPKRYRNRKLPLKIGRGYKDVDEFTIKIPEGYKIDLLPENRKIETKFGLYKLDFIKINETELKYTKTLFIKEGIYPKEDYKTYRAFRKSISKLENLRIAIVKK